MATLVGEADLVPSDLVAGLILVRRRHAGRPEPPSELPPPTDHGTGGHTALGGCRMGRCVVH